MRRSSRELSPTGGCSSPYALRSMRAASARTASTGSSASRSSASAGNGRPCSFSPSSTTRSGACTARPRSRPSTKSTFAPLDAGERRAEEAEELAARAAEPREAQQRGQRLAERRLVDANLAVDRIRDAERAERGLERRANAVDARADDADLLRAAFRREAARAAPRRRARARRARPRPRRSEPRRRSGRRGRLVGEHRALEMRQRGRATSP